MLCLPGGRERRGAGAVGSLRAGRAVPGLPARRGGACPPGTGAGVAAAVDGHLAGFGRGRGVRGPGSGVGSGGRVRAGPPVLLGPASAAPARAAVHARLKLHREADQDVLDLIRELMSLPVTLVLVGVGIPKSGLLRDGRRDPQTGQWLFPPVKDRGKSRNDDAPGQTDLRFDLVDLDRFSYATPDGIAAWIPADGTAG